MVGALKRKAGHRGHRADTENTEGRWEMTEGRKSAGPLPLLLSFLFSASPR